eukprot:TRINITY_DN11866_c0_g1_i1.p1 TRINITY_DN11866_c0_g1~~TRINITY_DN11866_c0_g1_i1.p1  ORF type:complete len:263 (+),score=72.04 TRINITY_DN11866_c0_g1_i1:32-820(+)
MLRLKSFIPLLRLQSRLFPVGFVRPRVNQFWSSTTLRQENADAKTGASSINNKEKNGKQQQPAAESTAEKTPEELKKALTEQQTKSKALEKNVADLEKKKKELYDQLLRTLAEMENVRRISREDVDRAKKYALSKFAEQLLEVCDTFAMAMQAAGKDLPTGGAPFKSLYDGLSLTEKILHKVMSQFKIVKFESKGSKLDPHLHEVLYEVDDPSKEPQTVAHVMKEGWKINERLLRPAQVGVVKARAEPAKAETPKTEEKKSA